MLLILTPDYNSPVNPHAMGFLHSRVKKYIENGIQTEVFILSGKEPIGAYFFEGVHVHIGSGKELLVFLGANTVETICIHFITRPMMRALDKIDQPRRVVVFVHGNEALHWYERIFPGALDTPRMLLGFCKYTLYNVLQIHEARRFFASSRHDIAFVAVSAWMKKKAARNWRCDKGQAWHIIPNIIDDTLFSYKKKQSGDACRLLSLRSFSSGKYANDLTVGLIQALKDEAVFDKLAITVIGKGALYKKTVAPLTGMGQVTLINDLFPQADVKKYHDKHGVFLCPTRQDAQGVSMCEAMASGLVPITLANTAIPEFLPKDERLYCHNVEDMKRLVLSLINDPQVYLELSAKCSDFARNTCSYANTVQKELELFSSGRELRTRA